jgi:hypothetical protein
VPRGALGRCGNINPLQAKEVVSLRPGQRIALDGWVGSPSLATPGKHKVQFRYANIPDLKWGGLALGKHDEVAMQQIRASTPVTADSNTIEIEVKQK